MKTYLKKIVEETSIDIVLQRIIGQDLCRIINKHTMQFPYKKDNKRFEHPIHDKINIYHNYLFYFFPRYLDTHFGNTLLVKNTPYKLA